MTSHIQLGAHRVYKIDYNQVEPGDIICTYEALSTNSKIEKLISFQKWISCKPRGELNKMFHFELVVDTYPRKGIYRIAHVNGSLGKVVLQDDNFKMHYPGQAFIVFRAKDPQLSNEIIRIALNTAREDNEQKCTRLPFSLWKIVLQAYRIAQCFIFENCSYGLSQNMIKILAQLTVDYTNSNGFYNYRKTELLSLGCPEYVACVVSVAKIRTLYKQILENRSLSRDELIEQIYNKIRSSTRESVLFNFNISTTSSAYLVDALFKSHLHFDCVGYIGYINQFMENSKLLYPKRRAFISNEALVEKLLPKNSNYQTINPLFIQNVLRVLKVVSEDGCLLIDSCKLDFKAKVALAYFHAKAYDLPIQEISNDEMEAFIQRFQALGKESRMIVSNCLPNMLSRKTQVKILEMEERFIRQSGMDRITQTYHLAMNEISRRYLYQNITQKLLQFFLCQNLAKKIQQIEWHQIKRLETAICYVYQEAKFNTYITFNASIPGGNRLWVHYSTDLGTTWDQEPLILENTIWKGYLRIPKKADFIYRFFIGPENIEDPNPIEQLKAWQKVLEKDYHNSDSAFKSEMLDNKKYHSIITSDSSKWEYINLN